MNGDTVAHPSHDSSCSVCREPPTVRRNICSSVIFSPDDEPSTNPSTAPVGVCAVKSIQAAGEVEKLRSSQTTEQRHAFRDNADLALHFDGILLQIESQDFNPPRTGRQQTGEHLDGGRFASAVRPEKAEKLP